ncbi:MAG: hypothetical protein WC511_04905 [Candidatus Pacearchaeota archaeon]
MKGRKFNSLMPKYNENWSAKILGMEVNSSAGPDLIDNEKAVEIKFKIIYEKRYAHKSWRTLKHQLEYDKDFPEIYWGLGFYKIDKKVEEMDLEEINEERILERELYIVKWDWMRQFPIYHETGRTANSEWNNYLLFPKFNLLPKTIYECNLESGKLFFTEGVNPKRFDINTKSL